MRWIHSCLTLQHSYFQQIHFRYLLHVTLLSDSSAEFTPRGGESSTTSIVGAIQAEGSVHLMPGFGKAGHSTLRAAGHIYRWRPALILKTASLIQPGICACAFLSACKSRSSIPAARRSMRLSSTFALPTWASICSTALARGKALSRIGARDRLSAIVRPATFLTRVGPLVA